MTQRSADEPLDERLGQLLEVERRLQQRVEAARQEAERRVVRARADGDRRRAEAEATLARQDEEQARTDHEAHERALAAIDAASRATLSRVHATTDDEIDLMARRALARAMALDGGTP